MKYDQKTFTKLITIILNESHVLFYYNSTKILKIIIFNPLHSISVFSRCEKALIECKDSISFSRPSS